MEGLPFRIKIIFLKVPTSQRSAPHETLLSNPRGEHFPGSNPKLSSYLGLVVVGSHSCLKGVSPVLPVSFSVPTHCMSWGLRTSLLFCSVALQSPVCLLNKEERYFTGPDPNLGHEFSVSLFFPWSYN